MKYIHHHWYTFLSWTRCAYILLRMLCGVQASFLCPFSRTAAADFLLRATRPATIDLRPSLRWCPHNSSYTVNYTSWIKSVLYSSKVLSRQISQMLDNNIIFALDPRRIHFGFLFLYTNEYVYFSQKPLIQKMHTEKEIRSGCGGGPKWILSRIWLICLLEESESEVDLCVSALWH